MLRRQDKAVIKGLLTLVPRVRDRYLAPGTGGANDAEYCYSVFLRHLVKARELHAWSVPVPARVAELGPGESLGVGLAALLAGAKSYVGLDVVQHASSAYNEEVFDGLIELFRRRAPIPQPPEVRPPLESYEFPASLLPGDWLDEQLTPQRLETLRHDLRSLSGSVRYVVPWDDVSAVEEGSIDFLWSQAVLEHVVDLPGTYAALHHWLSPTGLMSHEIDMRCHNLHDAWNGHWAFGPLAWRATMGAHPFLLNRAPYSAHRVLLESLFRVLRLEPHARDDGLPPAAVRAKFRTDVADVSISNLFVQATRLR